MKTKRIRFCDNEMLTSAVIQVKIDDIRPNRSQPRLEFDTNSIIRLADSIRRYGILHPLSIRIARENNYKYELVAGERRLRAAKSLGYSYVPCILIEADEKMSAELAIIENLLREDLNMFEEAYGFRQLIDNYSLTQEEIARKVSLSQSAVANKLRLLKLSYDEQCKIIKYELTERHARALLRVADKERRITALEYIAKHKLNVIGAEQYIDRLICEEKGASNEQNEPKNSENLMEKAKNDIKSAINRRIESARRAGLTATVNVSECDGAVEFLVKICSNER